jgi:hypothetical protein
LQRSEQNGRHCESGVQATALPHCGHLTTRGFIGVSAITIGLAFSARPIIIALTPFIHADPIYPRVSSAFGAGETVLCTAPAAASGVALTPASISKPAKVINAAAASVTAVSTIDPDMRLVLMTFSSDVFEPRGDSRVAVPSSTNDLFSTNI